MIHMLIGLCLDVPGAGPDPETMARWAIDPDVAVVTSRKMRRPLLICCIPNEAFFDTLSGSLTDPFVIVRSSEFAMVTVRNDRDIHRINPDLNMPRVITLIAQDYDGRFLGNMVSTTTPACVATFLDRTLYIKRMIDNIPGTVTQPDVLAALERDVESNSVTANCIIADRYRMTSNFEPALTYSRKAFSLSKTVPEKFESSVRLASTLIWTNKKLESENLSNQMLHDGTLPKFQKQIFENLRRRANPKKYLAMGPPRFR